MLILMIMIAERGLLGRGRRPRALPWRGAGPGQPYISTTYYSYYYYYYCCCCIITIIIIIMIIVIIVIIIMIIIGQRLRRERRRHPSAGFRVLGLRFLGF